MRKNLKVEFINPVAAGTPEIRLTGYIGDYYDDDNICLEEVKGMLDKVAEMGSKSLIIRLHTAGGSVFEGFAIYDAIKALKIDITTINEGICASMGSILFMAGTTRIMGKNSTLMIHKPKVGTFGSAAELTSAAEMLNQLEQNMFQVYKDATGQTDEIVSGWLVEGVDKYFNANSAKAVNLCTQIGDVDVLTEPIEDPEQYSDPEVLFNAVAKLTKPNQFLNMHKIAQVVAVQAAKMGLTANPEASEDVLANSIKQVFEKLEAQASAANTALDTYRKGQAERLVNEAIASAKIPADQKDKWLQNAQANFDVVADALALMPGKTDINNRLHGTTSTPEASAEDRSKWTFRDWSEKDPVGLEMMSDKDPVKFNNLVKNQF